MSGACSTHGRHNNILVEKPEEKRPLGVPTPRWEGIIKMNLKERECEDVD
jgi:hypothetical protein